MASDGRDERLRTREHECADLLDARDRIARARHVMDAFAIHVDGCTCAACIARAILAGDNQ